MTAMQKVYAHMELTDGSTHAPRVLLADKLKYETTARKHDWNNEPQTISEHVFLGWAAAKRAGITELGFDEFKDTALVDIQLTNDAPEGEAEADPTPESGQL